MIGMHEDADSHQACWERLPWYANGSLEVAERSAVEAHLSTCLVCRRELNYLQALGRALHAAELGNSDIESGLAATLARIDAGPPTPWARQSLRRRLGSALSRLWSELLDSAPAVRGAMAVQLLLLLALIGWLFLPTSLKTQPSYVTLSTPGSQTAPERVRLGVTFQDGATEKTMRELLTRLGGRIVDGPSATGRYTVELPIPPGMLGPDSPVMAGLRTDASVADAEILTAVPP